VRNSLARFSDCNLRIRRGLSHQNQTESSNPVRSTTQSEVQRNSLGFLQNLQEMGAILRFLLSNRAGESARWRAGPAFPGNFSAGHLSIPVSRALLGECNAITNRSSGELSLQILPKTNIPPGSEIPGPITIVQHNISVPIRGVNTKSLAETEEIPANGSNGNKRPLARASEKFRLSSNSLTSPSRLRCVPPPICLRAS
jgi:hypothetical protein